MSEVHVIGLRAVDEAWVSRAASFVSRTFAVDGLVGTPCPEIEPDPEPDHGQVASTELLRGLLAQAPGPGTRLLGLTETDLYLPTLSFVFGHAQLDGQVAVVSLYRLRPENEGLHADPQRLADRLVREVAHELGHTWGLQHCSRRTCCMSLSTSVEEVDTKTAEFCRTCRALLREAQRRERSRHARADAVLEHQEEARR